MTAAESMCHRWRRIACLCLVGLCVPLTSCMPVVTGSRTASVPTEGNGGSGSAVSGPTRSGGEGPGRSAGIDPSQVGYGWDGRPVSGRSTRLPDGTYYCYLSNAPAAASFTYWGAVAVSGDNLSFNGIPGRISYTSTTTVLIRGAGFHTMPRAVAFPEGNGHIVLWLRYQNSDARCA